MSQVPPIRLFALAALLATSAAYASGLDGNAAEGRELFMANGCRPAMA